MLQEHIHSLLPAGWMLMGLAGPQHSDGMYWCCLRTTDRDGKRSAVGHGPTLDQAFEAACAKAKSLPVV